jgi:hypothetical protein
VSCDDDKWPAKKACSSRQGGRALKGLRVDGRLACLVSLTRLTVLRIAVEEIVSRTEVTPGLFRLPRKCGVEDGSTQVEKRKKKHPTSAIILKFGNLG